MKRFRRRYIQLALNRRHRRAGNLRKFFSEDDSDKVIEQKINNFIAEGNTMIGDGTIGVERSGKMETSNKSRKIKQ